MTLDDILALTRQLAGDVDTAAYRYQVNELVRLMAVERRLLALRKIAALDTISITTTEGSEAVSPEPTDYQGAVLGYSTAIAVLERTYAERIDNGSMGISWRSGLEEESTINQEKAYRGMIEDLVDELTGIILIQTTSTQATRPQ